MKIIDIHTHGIGGYDTRTPDVEHILKIAEIHGSHGVSEIIPTIYPATIQVMRENMEVVRKAMAKQVSSLPRFAERGRGVKCQVSELEIQNNSSLVTRYSSLIHGVHLEGPFLNPSKRGALNAIAFIEPAEYNLKELLEGFEDMVRIITIAPELNGASRLIKKITDMGIIVSMGHSDATYNEAEAGFKAGAKGITHIFNAMRGFHHREPGLTGFGLLNREVYIEVIADPYHLHEKTLELIFKVKNPERIIIVSDSVKDAKTFPSNQAVMGRGGKLAGGCMTVTEASKRLIERGFDRDIIIKCISDNPERYLLSNRSPGI